MAVYQLDRDEITRLRALSERVFNLNHLLCIAVVMLETDHPVTQTELARAVGANHASSLVAPLQRLQAGQFITRADQNSAGERPLERCDSYFWDLVTELRQRAGETQDPNPQRALF